MRGFEIHIKEKQKFIERLHFYKLHDEVFNFMYKKTILEHSRKSLSFFILLHFLILKDNKGKSLLYLLFESYLEKAINLNKKFDSIKGNLKKGDYTKLVKNAGLTEVFRNDLFFHLIKCIFDISKFFIEYDNFFTEFPELKKELELINNKFGTQITEFYITFDGYKIEDTRIDENGEEQDLSKSVYHMVNMRMSKKLDLSLSYKTDIKNITSKSPIDITLFQYIDLNIIFDIWDKYNISSYIINIWGGIEKSPILSGTFGGVISGLVLKRLEILNTNGKTDKIKKNKLKEEYKELKKEFEKISDDLGLLKAIINSLLKSNENLKGEVDKLKEEIEIMEKNNQKKNLNTKKDEFKKLDNLVIKVEYIENQNIYNVEGNVEQIQNQTSDSTQNN